MPSGPFALCSPSSFANQVLAADTIRILVATDSHVGYEERDPIRKDDSWRSFDEVMQLARTQDVRISMLDETPSDNC
jgi:hypothetical protein